MSTGFVVRGDAIPVTVTSIKEPIVKSKKPVLKNSTFHVICNTNFRPQTNESARNAADELREAAESAFSSASKIAPMVIFKQEGDQWNEDIIKDVDVLMAVELGRDKRGRRVHCHIKVEINHYSKIHLNPVVIKEHVNLYMRVLRVQYVHIQVHAGRNWRVLEEYIGKQRIP